MQADVRRAQLCVATEIHDRPIRKFSCRALPLGWLQLFDISIDPIVIHRRFGDIAEDANDDYLLAVQVDGTVHIKQGGAEITQGPGSLALMSAGRPYSIMHAQHSRRLILHIPATVYRERILGNRKDEPFQARLFPGIGLASIVRHMLEALALACDELARTDQYTVAESLMELIAAIVRADAGKAFEKAHSRQSALFRRTLEYLEANFMNSELTPETVARANGISMRYLHSIFRQSGTSVSRWLWERRLKAAREDLLDPQMRHVRISEIAFRRGFNDPAHFSRTFRNRFDISPSRLRRQVARDPKSQDAPQ